MSVLVDGASPMVNHGIVTQPQAKHRKVDISAWMETEPDEPGADHVCAGGGSTASAPVTR